MFVKCMRQVTKGHLYHMFGVADYYVMYRHRAQSVCETSAKINDWVTDPLRWFCNINFCEGFVVKEGGNLYVSPHYTVADPGVRAKGAERGVEVATIITLGLHPPLDTYIEHPFFSTNILFTN